MLGSAKFSDDITVTRTDSDYMKRHYSNFYPDRALSTLSRVDQTAWPEFGRESFRPMYYIK